MTRLYKRGRVWYSDIFLHGKRIRKPLHTERRLAEDRLADLVKQRTAARFGSPGTVTFRAFRDRVLENVQTRLSRNTYIKYRSAFHGLSLATLEELTPEWLERVVDRWTREGRGPYEVNDRLKRLKAAVRRAEAWGWLPPRRWDIVKPLKTPRGRLLWYTQDEAGRLLRLAAGPWRTVVMLGLYAGLRRSEIAALRWEDVDYARNRLHVAPYEGFTPKDNERRWIPLASPLRAYLAALPQRSTHVLGRRYPLGVLTTYGRRLIRKAGLKGSLHTLRHTFAAWLASAGVPILTISRLLGHASVKTTEIYAHLAPESMEQAVAVLPACGEIVPVVGGEELLRVVRNGDVSRRRTRAVVGK